MWRECVPGSPHFHCNSQLRSRRPPDSCTTIFLSTWPRRLLSRFHTQHYFHLSIVQLCRLFRYSSARVPSFTRWGCSIGLGRVEAVIRYQREHGHSHHCSGVDDEPHHAEQVAHQRRCTLARNVEVLLTMCSCIANRIKGHMHDNHTKSGCTVTAHAEPSISPSALKSLFTLLGVSHARDQTNLLCM